MQDYKSKLIEKLENKDARIAVIGLGYVGLPLALDFVEAGFPLVGIDVNPTKIEQLKAGESYVLDVSSERLQSVPQGRAQYTTRYEEVEDCDVAIICVPTPLSKTRDPEMSFLLAASEEIARYAHPGMLVSLESTTYPGTTGELVRPLMEQNDLKVGEDIFLCFSPERIDPGRTDFTVGTTPKVVGGITEGCLEVGQTLYSQVIQSVVPVSSTEAAEMVKLLENTFRAVNIALVNEVAIMCDKLGLNVWEVVDAAATKPYGFMKFTPGPGVGGHCIPLDPHYLSWKLKTLDYNARFIQLAGEVNLEMPLHWVNKVQDVLNDAQKAVKGSRILVLGAAYKKDVSDVRESPALDIIEGLQDKGGTVQYYDPYVPEIRNNGLALDSETDLEEAVDAADCVVVVTDHSSIDWDWVGRHSKLLVDTRNVVRKG